MRISPESDAAAGDARRPHALGTRRREGLAGGAEGARARFSSEPPAGGWRRFLAWLEGLLPIEPLL